MLTTPNELLNLCNSCQKTRSPLAEFYDIASTSQDDNGLTLIPIIEAKIYPFWGVQFHPEMITYEWMEPIVPHSAAAGGTSQYFGDFFINQGSSLFSIFFYSLPH